jgi:molybdate transport system ATP-binding protein
LTGTVSAIHAESAFDHVIVQIAVGQILLLAEVTRDAIGRLGISVGMQLQALIKSVSIDLLAIQAANTDEGGRGSSAGLKGSNRTPQN